MKHKRETILHKMKQNMFYYMSYFAPHCPLMQILHYDATVLLTDVKDDTFNYIIDTHFTKENINERIEEISNQYYVKQLPFSWWVSPGDSPPNLAEELKKRGFVLKEKNYGMFLDLEKFHPKKKRKLDIKRVENFEEIKLFGEIYSSVCNQPNAFATIFQKVPSHLYQKEAPYGFYLGYINQKAVTGGVLVFHENVAGIYCIMTIPQERKKGYATEMMDFLLKEAKTKKQEIASLQASEQGKEVYKKMGFEEICEIQEYFLKEK